MFIRTSLIKVEIYHSMKGLHLTFCVISKLKHVFLLPYSQCTYQHVWQNWSSLSVVKFTHCMTELKLAFCSKITWNNTFEATNHRRIIEGNIGHRVTRPNNNCKETTVSMAQHKVHSPLLITSILNMPNSIAQIQDILVCTNILLSSTELVCKNLQSYLSFWLVTLNKPEVDVFSNNWFLTSWVKHAI